jgi:hypothetical protein
MQGCPWDTKGRSEPAHSEKWVNRVQQIDALTNLTVAGIGIDWDVESVRYFVIAAANNGRECSDHTVFEASLRNELI